MDWIDYRPRGKPNTVVLLTEHCDKMIPMTLYYTHRVVFAQPSSEKLPIAADGN